jgi:lysophospholipase L1-like esterase
MKPPCSSLFRLLQTATLLLCGISAQAQTNPPAQPPRVAFLGDSIAMDGRWVILVESALRATPGYASAVIVNFSLSSETTSGLSEPGHAGGEFPRPCVHERLGRVLAAFNPTLVLACYGMNDGIYLPLDPARFKAYQDGMTKLKADVEKAGARFIAITPPLYMADTPSNDSQHYNAVLDAYAGWLVDQRAKGWLVVDMRPALRQAVADAKKADPQFIYSKDTVHPDDAGHRLIAEAVWPGLAKILNLPATPKFAQGEALATLTQREHLLQNAWMTDTGHLRPGCPGYRKPGEPLPKTSAVKDSEGSADQLLSQYQKQ